MMNRASTENDFSSPRALVVLATLCCLLWGSTYPAIKGGYALLSAAAFALWAALLKYNPVTKVAVFNFLVPVFGALLSALFLGETVLQWRNALALVLVCAGIWLVTTQAVRGAPR